MALTVASVTHTAFTTDTTAHLVAMPATVNVDDLLVCCISADGNPTITVPTGWTSLSTAANGTVLRGAVILKIAVGTEGGTSVDFVTSATEQVAAQVYRITGAVEIVGTGMGTVESTTPVASTPAGIFTFDPGAATPSWGAMETLYITYLAGSSNVVTSSGPSGWSTPELTNENPGTGTASAQVRTAWLISSAASEDPGVWTLAGSGTAGIVQTVMVRAKVGAVGRPANTLAGASVNSTTTQTLSIPAVASGAILLVQGYGRRGSTTLAPNDPSIADSSAVPLAWTACFSPVPVQVGVNPGIKCQWWWARADGAAKTVTLTWVNADGAPSLFASVASFTIGAGQNPDFTNQAYGGNTGTGAVTTTLPTLPTTGINMLSFYGSGGSNSTIATGYTTLTNVASSPYRTGYDMTPGANAVMGASFPDQLLVLANIVEVAQATSRLGKIWNGSAWVVKPVKVWSGSAWVAKPSKIWNGSAWV